MKTKRIAFFITFLFVGIHLMAQSSLNGKIIDEANNKEPIIFSEIILTKAGSDKIVVGDVSDDKGEFSLTAANDNYTLQILYVGKILFTKEIELTEDIDLGTIEVNTSLDLEAVVVVGTRRLIERKVDRLVFNVENTMRSSSGDALEVLKVTPGVQVSNDQVAITGRSGVLVMINNKIIQVPQEEVANFLKSIPSEDIKKIEVITTPPAKYEAAGNSGLINIQLKKGRKDSWTSMLRSTYVQRTFPASNYLATFDFNKKNLSVASSIYYRTGMFNKGEQDIDIHFPDGLWSSESPFIQTYDGLSARVDLSYDISPKWTTGAQYVFNATDNIYTSTPRTSIFEADSGNEASFLQSNNRSEDNPSIHSVNFFNGFNIDTLGRRIEVNLDYFNYVKPDVNSYDGVSVVSMPYFREFYAGTNINDQEVENISAKVDVEVPTKWMNLSFGGKITNSTSLNNISAFNSGLVENPVTQLPLSDNDFKYVEDIQALYFSGNRQLGKKVEFQLGLRAERTATETSSENLNLFEENDYIKLFPTFYLSYRPGERSTFALSYSRRISRPAFNNVNPNVYFLNPFQTVEGNAFLQPAFIDNVEISHSHGNFISKIFYSYEDNVFGQVPIADSNTNILRYRNENYIDGQAFGISENYIFDKYKRWTSNNSVDLYYQIFEFVNLPFEQDKLENFGASFTTSNDFSLDQDRTFSLNVFYAYYIPGQQGVFNLANNSIFSLSLQKMFLEKDLVITLRGNDIFRTRLERLSGTVNGIFQEVRGYYDSQSIEISLSYKLGNKNVRAKFLNTGNSDERNRTGN